MVLRAVLGPRASLAVLVSLIATPLSGLAHAQAAGGDVGKARQMRVDECVDLALRRNVDVQTAGVDVVVVEAQRAEVRGLGGPKIRVDAYAREWNSAFNLPFSLDPAMAPVPFPVRDQFEWNGTVSATQPLTGLLAIFEGYKIRTLGVDIANIRREIVRREVAYRVVDSYFRLVQAARLVEVAGASVEQLKSHLKQSSSFHANGVVSRDDVLRAELALASAQLRLTQMRSRESLEQAQLAVLVGVPADTIIQAMPASVDQVAELDGISLPVAERQAEARRMEIVEVDERLQQASREVNVARLKLAPQISAVGAYIHNVGSKFVEKNSAYVGATASWDVWDWGATTSAISAAKARAQQATLARTKIWDQIRLEVRRAHVELSSANEAIVVARASVASAEENFRLVTKRYEASSATSFDVVDAEALLTTARGQMETALYDRILARASLRRATGAVPKDFASN